MISRDPCQKVLQKAVLTGDYAERFTEHNDNRNIAMIANRVDSITNAVIAGK